MTTYNAGTHSITVSPGQSIVLELYGAGGGGGVSVFERDRDAPNLTGKDGGDTILSIGSTPLVTVGGGKGGTHGRWANGSAYINGAGGAGGLLTIAEGQEAYVYKDGIIGGGTITAHLGGKSLSSLGFGAGGNGGDGVGDNGWAYGGGGGSGSFARAIYTNNTAADIILTLEVGKGGVQGSHPSYTTRYATAGKDGYVNTTDLASVLKHVNIVRSGVIKAGQPAKIAKTALESYYKYSDRSKVGILVCPEGGHEGWSVSRTDNDFTINVWDRSGTNRVGYSGNINWIIFEISDAPNKSGIARSGVTNGGDFTISAPLGVDFSDTSRYGVFISPEGGHEAWSIWRSGKDIRVSVFDRSGKNRVGYSGSVSWMVVDLQAALLEKYPFIKTVETTSTDNVVLQGSNYNNPDNTCVFVCPNGSHEAWTVNRSTKDKVWTSIFNRSGTSRIGYAGLNYMMAVAFTPNVNEHVYGVGYSVINLLPTQTIDIYAFGAGGGGGNSVYTGGSTDYPGTKGGDTTVSVGDKTYTAGGGGGGTAGWWGNGSHMSEGTGGAGGVPTVSGTLPTKVDEIYYGTANGTQGYIQTWSPQYEVPANELDGVMSNNTGGRGAWGIGDESRAGGGSGGTGAALHTRLTNNGNISVAVKLNVGARGTKGAAVGNVGTDGGDGSVYLFLSDVSRVRKKDLTATLKVSGNSKGTAAVEFLYTEDSRNTLEIPSTYDKNHINLWDFFKDSQGRNPDAGEEIVFVIPESRVFVAPFGYVAATRTLDANGNFKYDNSHTVFSKPAVSLKGWDKALNNKITVDVRGKLIGSFGNSTARRNLFTPYDISTGKKLTWDTFSTMSGFADPVAAWWFIQCLAGVLESPLNATSNTFIGLVMTGPVKNPAFYTDVDCRLVVRSGGYILGGGGYQNCRGMYSRSDIPDEVSELRGITEDETNVHGGDAIHVGGAATKFRVENYGVISGGGGGGASAGREPSLVMDYTGVFAPGGKGAPLGGADVVTFPIYINLEYIKTLPLIAKTINNDYTAYFSQSIELGFPSGVGATTNIIEVSPERIVGAVDMNRVGVDSNGDNVSDISIVKDAIANTGRLLSPTAGVQVTDQSNTNSVISGSGGSIGISGQQYTVVKGDSWLSTVPNTAGQKGRGIVNTTGTVIIDMMNYPGSVYNP